MGCVSDPREAERIVYAEYYRCAEQEIYVTKVDDIAHMLGGASMSTVPGRIDKRLEKKGLIRVRSFQRGKQVFVVELNKWTAPPANTAPHWRDRPKNIPTVAIHTIAEKKPDIAMWIQNEAKRLGKPPFEFIADLVYIGAVEYQAVETVAGASEGML